jgi:hypothetical protein
MYDYLTYDKDRLLLAVILLLGLLAATVFYLLTLQRTLTAISPEKRQLQPGLVWLMLVPFFNFVWNFIVVSRLANSIRAEYDRLHVPNEEKHPTYGVGMAQSVLALIACLPGIGNLAAIVGCICWIVYWVKVNECRKLIQANQDNVELDAEKGIFHASGTDNQPQISD